MSDVLNLEQEKLSEMAMVDLAYHLLTQTKKPAHYRELFNEVVERKNMTQEDAMNVIAQVYTEINLDGRFICLGDNLWGLKRWYLVETQEESAEGGLRGKFALDDDDDFDDDFDDDEELEEEYGLDDDEPVNDSDDDADADADVDDDDDEDMDGFEEEADEEFADEDLDDETDSEDDEDLDM